MSFVIPPPAPSSVPVVGSQARFPVRRIYCVGRNYVAHAQEMGFSGQDAPFFFLKPADAILPVAAGATGTLPYPAHSQNLHHEVELVVALGKDGRNIAPQQALEHVWGYAVGLDMTCRDIQDAAKKQGRPWCASKAFEASAPIAPLTPAAQVPGIAQATIDLQVNGQPRQHSHLGMLICDVAHVIAHLSQTWELQPGDLIFTGTPEGVAAVQPGDVLDASIQGLTPLRVQVAA